MRVAINASALLGTRTGIGQYTRQLITEIPVRQDIELSLFAGRDWAEIVPPDAAGGSLLKKVAAWMPGALELNRLVRQYRFDRGARSRMVDVYHEPGFVPYRFDGPTVVSVHDLSFIRFPHMHPPARVAYMERHVPRAIESASVVLTDSEFIKNELVDLFGTDPAKVVAIPLGASGGCRPATESEIMPVLGRYGLSFRRYLLTVGTFEPRKNLVQVVRAYRALPDGVQARLPLAMVGARGWRNGDLDRELAAVRGSDRVRILGYVPDEDLYPLYSGALAFIYPSLYEGFGLPPLEAMASATPVIVSDRASLLEVVGEAGLVCNPDGLEELRDAILRLLEDAGERQRLISAGLAQARKFSWRRCASETVDAYRKAIGSGRS